MGHCSQDMAYTFFAQEAGIGQHGPTGCGQPDAHTSSGELFPLTCWELGCCKRPDSQVEAVKTFALMDKTPDPKDVEAYFKDHEMPGNYNLDKTWHWYYLTRNVPVFHHFNVPDAHRLARELLGK